MCSLSRAPGKVVRFCGCIPQLCGLGSLGTGVLFIKQKASVLWVRTGCILGKGAFGGGGCTEKQETPSEACFSETCLKTPSKAFEPRNIIIRLEIDHLCFSRVLGLNQSL